MRAAACTLLTLAAIVGGDLAAAEPPDGTVLATGGAEIDADLSGTDIVNAAAVISDPTFGALLGYTRVYLAGWASYGAGERRMVGASWSSFLGRDWAYGGHNDGLAWNPFQTEDNSEVNAIAVLPDGRALLAGTYDHGGGDTDFAVVRLTAGGSVDTSFGDNGRRLVAFNLGDDHSDDLAAMVVDRAGRIILVGSADYAAGDRDWAVARLTAEGDLDPAFDGDGKKTVPIDGSGAGIDVAHAVALTPDGRIVIAGSARYQPLGGSISFNFAAVRLLASGALDPSFGVGGKWTASPDNGGSLIDQLWSVAVDDQGRIVLGGEIAWAAGEWHYMLVRLLPDGSADASFNGTGSRQGTYCCSVGRDAVYSLALQGDGKIVFGGPAYGNDATSAFAAARLRFDGTLDASFAVQGTLVMPQLDTYKASSDDLAKVVLVGPDGRLTVAGTYEHDSPDINWFWAGLANSYIFADAFERGNMADW